jgi:hypothetical protein
VSAQVLTYPQNSACRNYPGQGLDKPSGNRLFWCQVIDSSNFFRDASNLSDQGAGTMNQAFGGASASFPTKLSTETVGDFKISYGS